MKWIDTHCHLDAFNRGNRSAEVGSAGDAGVAAIVIPAIHINNFSVVIQLAHQHSSCAYALGIHPLCVPAAQAADLQCLEEKIVACIDDAKLVAIGEIGLDFFVPALCTPTMRDKQEFFYCAQLKLARQFNLPVLLHVRRSVDRILRHLRQISLPGGIAHAFNGSFQQAQMLIDLGYCLGFGGAMTFPRALQIRRLASQLPVQALVLETDAPDISPVWLHPQPNTPMQIPGIGGVLASLRGMALEEIATITTRNALRVLPRLKNLLLIN